MFLLCTILCVFTVFMLPVWRIKPDDDDDTTSSNNSTCKLHGSFDFCCAKMSKYYSSDKKSFGSTLMLYIENWRNYAVYAV